MGSDHDIWYGLQHCNYIRVMGQALFFHTRKRLLERENQHSDGEVNATISAQGKWWAP